jgi:porin
MGTLSVGFDTAGAGWWQGGEFYASGEAIHGRSLTDNYLGDLQVASNIDGGRHAYLRELWFRQRLGSVTLTAGLQDLNADFLVTEGGGEFLNSSFGIPLAVSLGVDPPIFPLTGLGLAARWEISERWVVQGAVFDGAQTGFERNPHNVNWHLGPDEGALTVAEVHLDRRYKFGAYYHTRSGNHGLYASVDQPLSERVGVFLQAVVAPKCHNDNNYYIGSGVNLTRVFSRRGRDLAGVAVAHAGLHSTAHRHETALELYYKYRFTEHIALQPDLQYVINPSGGESPLSNALVGIVRLWVEF